MQLAHLVGSTCISIRDGCAPIRDVQIQTIIDVSDALMQLHSTQTLDFSPVNQLSLCVFCFSFALFCLLFISLAALGDCVSHDTIDSGLYWCFLMTLNSIFCGPYLARCNLLHDAFTAFARRVISLYWTNVGLTITKRGCMMPPRTWRESLTAMRGYLVQVYECVLVPFFVRLSNHRSWSLIKFAVIRGLTINFRFVNTYVSFLPHERCMELRDFRNCAIPLRIRIVLLKSSEIIVVATKHL